MGGVVAYHDTVYEAIHIDDGTNDLAGALDYVKITSFAGARPNVAKVVIPIVHMMPQSEKVNIVDAATRLKNDCVTILGLGIRGSTETEAANGLNMTDVVDRATMEQVVSWPGSTFYLEFEDFVALENAGVFA